MALLRSLPENATLANLRRTYADLLEKLRPYGQRLMRGPSPLTPGERELIAAFVSGPRIDRGNVGLSSEAASTASSTPKARATKECRLVEGAGIVGTTEEYSVAAQRLVEHGYLRGAVRRGRIRTRSKSVSPRRRTRPKR